MSILPTVRSECEGARTFKHTVYTKLKWRIRRYWFKTISASHRCSFKAIVAVMCILFILNMLNDAIGNRTVVYTSSTHDAYIKQYVQREKLLGYESDQNYTENNEHLHTIVAQRRYNEKIQHVNCAAMFRGDHAAIEHGREYGSAHPRRTASNDDYVAMATNCSRFRQTRGYTMKPLSKEEYDFPIAFSILMYDGVEQVERLLRSIYAPQNVYCIHVDHKADDAVLAAMMSVSRCFPNVFIASRLESVYWGHISIVLAEMNCLHDLMPYRWRYFVNLSGQMFPLHSNAELVKILKLYDGANDVEGTFKRSRKVWMRIRQAVSWHLVAYFSTMFPTVFPKGNPPHNVTIYKGSNQAVLTREFVEYLLFNKTAIDLLEWFKDTFAPDEYLWPTINHNPHLRAPGAYTGDPETKTFTARGTVWTAISQQINWSWKKWDCHGKWVRNICIFGVGDLPWLRDRPELFANKFHSDFEDIVYDCMEDLIFNRTLDGHNRQYDLSYYERLPFVRDKELVIAAQRFAKDPV